jgi:exosortase K
MKQKVTWNWIVQLVIVLIGAYLLKRHYSTASVNELCWILAPTATLVELISGASFAFESHAGYLSSDRSFLIAKSCAGVNFLLTAFLMLVVSRWLRDRSQNMAWRFIPTAALIAYLVTLAANTIRITVALQTRQMPGENSWLLPAQLHRLEGILIYFGFLLLLFVVSERMSAEKTSGLLRQSFLPLLIYYATTLGIPLANGAHRQTPDFWEHSLLVLLIPLLLILSLITYRMIVQDRLRRQHLSE